MITITIVAILISMVLPSVRVYMQNSRMSAVSRDIITSLMLAKAESVGRSNFVTVCKSTDASACMTTGGWEQGWITFVDVDADGVRDTGEEILKIQVALPNNNQLTLRGTSLISNRITYHPNGLTNLSSTQTLMLCDERGYGANARGIVLSILGKGSLLLATDTSEGDCLL